MASLPWYDFPEMHAANDAFWSKLAVELRALSAGSVPATLDRALSQGHDRDAAYLFTQTCGYPLLTSERDRFKVLATPCYGVAGCAGPLYRSFIVVRDDSRAGRPANLRDTRFAVNQIDSNSGINLPRRLFAPLARRGRFFAGTIVTGSHEASAGLVTAGGADAAAIDCVTFAFLERYRPASVHRLRILAETSASFAPPFVTARAADAATVCALRMALQHVARAPAHTGIREALYLNDVESSSEAAYATILAYAQEARELGYPELR